MVIRRTLNAIKTGLYYFPMAMVCTGGGALLGYVVHSGINMINHGRWNSESELVGTLIGAGVGFVGEIIFVNRMESSAGSSCSSSSYGEARNSFVCRNADPDSKLYEDNLWYDSL